MRSKVKKHLLIVVLATIVLILSIWLIWRHYHNAAIQKANPPSQISKINSANSSPPITEQNNSGDNNKQPANGNSTSPTVGGATPRGQTGTITISRLNQGTNGIVSLRTIVTGLTSGKCTAVFSQGQKSFKQESNVIPNATYYSCADIDVPASSFNASGNWNVSIMIVDSQGSSVSNTVTSSLMVQ